MNKHRIHVHEDLISSAFFLIFSVAYYLQGLKLNADNFRFPSIFVIIIFVLSLYTFAVGIKKTIELNKGTSGAANGDSHVREVSWARLKGPILVLMASLLYLLAIKHIGFFVSTVVFVPVSLLAQGYKKPIVIGTFAASLCVVIYFVFVKLLELVLPEGILF